MNDLETTIRLVQAAQAGDDVALNKLFERYLPRTRHIVALRMGWRLKQLREHEDLVQETMIKVFRGLGKFEAKTEGSFRHWVACCVERAIRDSVRAETRQKRGRGRVRRFSDFPGESLSSSIFKGSAPTPSQVVQATEMEEKIEKALLSLPERYRELILLRSFCDMSYGEIADALGFDKPGTVRQAYSRAVQKLRELLDASDQ